MGILVSHYKDPYQPSSTMGCHKGFERCSIVLRLFQHTELEHTPKRNLCQQAIGREFFHSWVGGLLCSRGVL